MIMMKRIFCVIVFYVALVFSHPLSPGLSSTTSKTPASQPQPLTTQSPPKEQTTRQAQQSQQTFVTAPLCPNKLDIVLVIDSSGSVQKSWDDLIDDAQTLLSNFIIGPDNTRVGIIDYSAVANVYLPLDSNNTDESVYRSLQTMRSQPQNGETWVELGLDRATEVFVSATPVREDARKVIVMYTDGKQTSGDVRSIQALIKAQRDQNIETFIVKPCKNISSEALQMMASSHLHIYKMNEEPPMGMSSLRDAICWNTGTVQSTTASPDIHTTSSVLPVEIKPTPAPSSHLTTVSISTTTGSNSDRERCYLPSDAGPSRAFILRFYYDSVDKQCKIFSFGGSGGNANNFQTYKECQDTCEEGKLSSTSTPNTSTDGTKTNESASTNDTRPSNIVDSKCELEKEHALWLLSSNIPTAYQIFVPECSEDGKYKPIQHHEGTGYSWCVDVDTGDVINGTKVANETPKCPEKTDQNSSHQLTKCQKEKKEKTLLAKETPDIFVPTCSLFDGLYLEVQTSAQTGEKWCVNRYTGELINGTTVGREEGNPLCPEKTKCETEREEAVSSNYREPKSVGSFVPQCQVNGLYTKVQVHGATGNAWCVDEVTGDEINGTRTSPGEGMPACPGEVNPICLLPKLVGPCKASVPRYFFNEKTASCEKFTYGGCNGNANNFETYHDCQSACGMLTKCLIEKEEASLREPIANETVFVPECTEDGLYKSLQRFYNDSTWCVDQKTGRMIEGTIVEFKDADCSSVPSKPTTKQRELLCHETVGKLLSGSATSNQFIPACTEDGHFQEIQKDEIKQEHWCVHIYTGVEIEGTRKNTSEGSLVCPEHSNKDCLLPKDSGPCLALFPRFYYDWKHNKCFRFLYGGCMGNQNNYKTLKDCELECQRKGNNSHPQTKCEKEKEKNEAMIKMLPDLFIPVCNSNDGLYEEIQENGMTGGKWCVDRETGETVTGTYVKQGNPDCSAKSGNSSVLRPMTKCERERETGTFLAQTIPDYFVFKCNPDDGLYEEIQENGMTGGKWCVERETGETINGTYHKREDGMPDCPGSKAIKTNETSNADGTGNKGNNSNGVNNETAPVVEPPLPIPTPEPEPLPPSDFDIYNPTNPCKVELDFAKQRNNGRNMVGGFLPQCEENGDYKQMQVYGSSGSKWCVDKTTGHLIDGTLVGPGNHDPDCVKASQSGNNTIKPVIEPLPEATPEPEVEPSLDFDMYHPTNPCKVELDFAKQRNNGRNMVGGFLPQCEENGDYKQMQVYGSSGSKWCVDKTTGHLIDGTLVGPGNPDPDCVKATSNPGESPSNNGSHIVQPEPEPETGPAPSVDIYHPKNPCSTELDFAKQRMGQNLIGAFIPQCDENGSYKELQTHGSSGYRWCVDKQTGHVVNGTMTGPGSPTPDCAKVNKTGQTSGNKSSEGKVVKIAEIVVTNKTTQTPSPTVNPTPAPQPTIHVEEVDIYHPKNPCSQEAKYAEEEKLTNYRPDAFVPQCDEHGNYKPRQTYGSTGYTWCVNPKTGHEIPGTRVGPGSPAPNCTTDGTAPVLEASTIPSTAPHVWTTPSPTKHSNTSANTTNKQAMGTKPGVEHTENKDGAKEVHENVEEERKELEKLADDCPFEIGVNLTKIGCYNDDQQVPQPFPQLLVKDTSINLETPSKNDDWKGFVRAFVCKCAIVTQKKGWFSFGIQKYGECFSGPDEGRFDEDGEASENMCINEEQESCKKDKQFCAGISKQNGSKKVTANYVYMIKTKTHTQINRIEYDKKKRHIRQKKRHSKRHFKRSS